MGFFKEITKPFTKTAKQIGRSAGDIIHGTGKVLGEGFKISNEFMKSTLSPEGLMSGLIGWGLGGPLGALTGLGLNAFGGGLMGDVSEQMPTMLAPTPPAATDAAKEAEAAASEAARRRAEEERRRRALYGRESTFSGKQTGLLGAAPIGKKTLLGQ